MFATKKTNFVSFKIGKKMEGEFSKIAFYFWQCERGGREAGTQQKVTGKIRT